MPTTRIRQMGNSLGVVIPSAIVKQLGLEKGQDINVEFLEATNQLIFTDKEKKEASSVSLDLLHQVIENAVENALQKRDNKS
ncbi:AbrB/MazE/SpoVT family DNA-binding domain-containing protein [Priestia megaterium]|uniref:AbrB/MazE/SpoVT family DNA-binding domain-containing protein n=1 Tax=Priestia megaterium TaxID=1404 RepID=UPI003CC6C361